MVSSRIVGAICGRRNVLIRGNGFRLIPLTESPPKTGDKPVSGLNARPLTAPERTLYIFIPILSYELIPAKWRSLTSTPRSLANAFISVSISISL